MLRKYSLAILPLLIGIVSAITGILTNIASNQLPAWLDNYLWLSWPLFAFFTVLGIALVVAQARAEKAPSVSQRVSGNSNITFVGDHNTIQRIESLPLSSDQKQALRNRQNMLKLVYNTWIVGVLQNSIHRAEEIELDMETQPDAVGNPWEVQVQFPNREPEMLPPGKKILQVFEESNCSLLILGEPGAGKTTTLLQLAEQAIERAKNSDEQPIPVVFNLSSWIPKQTIADWLISDLKNKYYVPNKLGSQWVEQNELLLLLDGLDEVKAEYRVQCAAAINTFLEGHPVPVAVCCRKEEYKEMAQQMKLDKLWGAVLIQSLSLHQIDWYLSRTGKGLARVYQVLNNDGSLHNFFQTPLALSILLMAYRNASPTDITTLATATDQRKQLFDVYIQQMLERRGQAREYSSDEIKRWLAYLAYQLKRRGQSVFYIESIDQGWLLHKVSLKRFNILHRLIFGLIVGLIVGLLGGLVVELIVGPVGGLSFGLIGVLSFGLIVGPVYSPTEKLSWSWGDAKKKLIGVLRLCLIVGLGIGLSFGLNFGLLGGLIVGLIGALIVGLIGRLNSAEVTYRSRPEQGLQDSRKNALLMGLLGGLSFGLLGGLSFGLIFGLSVGVISGSSFGLIAGLSFGLSTGLIAGLSGGLSVGLRYGGNYIISHYSLRWTLHRIKLLPWNLVVFLDYVTDRIFLRKVGGGYIFIHRTLMEHFASMWEEKYGTERTT